MQIQNLKAMKKLMIVILLILTVSPALKAQVSGSNGNRIVVGANVTPGVIGYLFDENEFSFGYKLTMDYIFHRDKSFGIAVDYDRTTAYYNDIEVPHEYDYYYTDKDYLEPETFLVNSFLIEGSMKFRGNGGIAPMGGYGQLLVGVMACTHEFDVDLFRSNLNDDIANPADAEIAVNKTYYSPYIGFAFGESYPLYTNLFLDVGVSCRLFLVKNSILNDFADNDYNGEGQSTTTDNMLAFEVLDSPVEQKSITLSVGIRYAF